MSRSIRSPLLAVAILGVAACQDAPTVTESAAPPVSLALAPISSQGIPGQYIVVFDQSIIDAPGRARQLASAHRGTLLRTYNRAIKGFAVRLPEGAVQALRMIPGIAYIEQDQVIQLNIVQDNATWGLDRLDQRLLPLSTTYEHDGDGTGVTAYIIDTGILFGHQEFGGRATGGFDAIGGGTLGADCNGHGTHVAGTVGGSTYGVAKNVSLIAVRVLSCSGSGSTSGVIAGIDWVTTHHQAGQPAVANMSLGGGASQALDDAVARSVSDGVVYGVAAGNSNFNACSYSPARAPSAITVGSTTSTDARSSFSNYGSCVDLFAPGSGITSAWYTSTSAVNTISGTSMATPHLVGAAALYLEDNPTATPAQVEAGIETNATKGKVTSAGTGSPNLLLFTGLADPPPPYEAPVARYTWSCSNRNCTFNGSTSTGSSIVSYNWTFTSTRTGSGNPVTHRFSSSGTYNVALKVTDAMDATNTRTCAVRTGTSGTCSAP